MDTIKTEDLKFSAAQGIAHKLVKVLWQEIVTEGLPKTSSNMFYMLNLNITEPKNGTQYSLFSQHRTEQPRDVLNKILFGKDTRPSISLNVFRSGKVTLQFIGDWSKVPGTNGMGKAPEMFHDEIDPDNIDTIQKFKHKLREAAVALMAFNYGPNAALMYGMVLNTVAARHMAKDEMDKRKELENKLKQAEVEKAVLFEKLQAEQENVAKMAAVAREAVDELTQYRKRAIDKIKPVLNEVSGLMKQNIPASSAGPVWNAGAVNVWNEAQEEPKGWNAVHKNSGITNPFAFVNGDITVPAGLDEPIIVEKMSGVAQGEFTGSFQSRGNNVFNLNG